MATLSYRSAAKIAAREMHSSRGKFFFVILSVAIGVAALTGVRGFSASFRTTLLLRARSIMAADLSARTFQQLTPEEQRSVDSIPATVVNEPDRLSGSFTVGPRVFLSRAALSSTGLLAPGNRASERVLFKLP